MSWGGIQHLNTTTYLYLDKTRMTTFIKTDQEIR